MKSAKRVLAVAIALLMIISTCAIAASAAVQDEVTAATDGYTLKGQTVGSIEINNKDNFVLDLNGYELVSDYGKAAITINNSTNVTIRNGMVTSRFADEHRILKVIEGLKDGKAPSGIVINGGNVTIEGVRVDAGRTVVPEVGWEIPAGSGLQITGNAKVTLKQTSVLGGDYAIYNSNGTVIVEDALLAGAFAAALKPANVKAADGTEPKVNAADRITGVLSSGVTLDPDEQELLDTFMGDRINIYTKKIVDKAPVTVTNGKKVDVEAEVISHLWAKGKGGKGTDCSYKYVPEYLVLENGTTYALTEEDGKYVAHINGEKNVTKEAQILYRLEFEIAEDIKELISEYYNWDYYWSKIPAKVRSSWAEGVEAYDGYIAQFKDAFDSILNLFDTVYEETGHRVDLYEDEDFMAVVRDLFAIGGSTVQKEYLTQNFGGRVGYDRLTNSAYRVFYDDASGNVINAWVDANGKYYFGEEPDGEAQGLYVYGLLDKLDLYKNDLAGFVANVADESTWGDVFYWVYANWNNALDLIPETNAVLKQLKADLDKLDIAEVAGTIADFQDMIDLIDDGIDILDQTEAVLPELEQNENYVAIFDFLEGQEPEWIKACMDKALEIYHNRDRYVDVDALLLEGGNFAKGYAVYGPIELIPVTTGDVEITVTIDGAGDADTGVTIALDGAAEDVASGETYLFEEFATVTANPAGYDEFLYFVNAETNRILTTEPTLTFDTKINRNIRAVFMTTKTAVMIDNETFEANLAKATFANNSGAICAAYDYAPNADGTISMVDQVIGEPYLPGYTFDGWAYSDGSVIDTNAAAADANNKYLTGNSVFADMNQYYDNAGYALPVRANSLSYIMLPKFKEGDPAVMVEFWDSAANTIYESEMPYGSTVTITAAGDNFSYWIDGGTGAIVSFDPAFTYMSIGNRAEGNVCKRFEAVYGKSYAKPAASRVAFAAKETERVSLYFQRAVKSGYTVESSGIVYKFDSNEGLDVNADGANTRFSKNTDRVGTYVLGVSNAKCAGHSKLYARAFVEIDGQTYYGNTLEVAL